MTTLDLIREKQEQLINAEAAKARIAVCNRKTLTAAFKPIRDMWDEVKDTIVPAHRHGCKRERLPLERHLSSIGYEHITLFNMYGNDGPSFGVELGNSGTVLYYAYCSRSSNLSENCAYAQLKELFIEELARRIF